VRAGRDFVRLAGAASNSSSGGRTSNFGCTYPAQGQAVMTSDTRASLASTVAVAVAVAVTATAAVTPPDTHSCDAGTRNGQCHPTLPPPLGHSRASMDLPVLSFAAPVGARDSASFLSCHSVSSLRSCSESLRNAAGRTHSGRQRDQETVLCIVQEEPSRPQQGRSRRVHTLRRHKRGLSHPLGAREARPVRRAFASG
jgi:hypothetical protein